MTHPTVLITGAAGFIGSHLTDRCLAEGSRVIGVDNFCDFYDPAVKRRHIEPALGNDRFELVEADIRDRQAMLNLIDRVKPDTIVHLAAMAGVRPSIENPDLYVSVNLDGTINLLDAAVASGVKRFAFASSSSVYGNNEKVPFAEDDPVDHPISPYAATKKAGELLAHTYWHVHKLPIVCLRFFTVFGPRQRPDLAIGKFLRRIHDGQSIAMFGDGSSSRDYTYVDDIVDGIRRAMDRCSPEVGYRVYNLGGSEPVTLREMIQTIVEVVGKPAQIDQQPMQPGDVDRTWADLTRSEAELGYFPGTTFAEGVARQWAWLREQR